LSRPRTSASSTARKVGVLAILNEVAGNDPDALHARAFMDALKSPSQKLRGAGPSSKSGVAGVFDGELAALP
jgi:hypothetical protein